MRRNKFISLRSDPISLNNSKQRQNNKVNLSGSKYDTKMSLANPYLKNYKIRKINRTEESLKSKQIENQVIKQSKITLEKLNGSYDIKTKERFYSIRMQTQKSGQPSQEEFMNSCYYKKLNRLNTIVHEPVGSKPINTNPFTQFQAQQTYRYEIFYVGRRRIYNLSDVTMSSGDAKIQIGDAIIYRYEIIKILGEGSFGKVFKVFDHKKKQFFALKIIRNHPKFNAQAKIEIKILETVIINDPKFKSNIVQLKHGFFFRGHACLVFQLLHLNLYEFLKLSNFKGLPLDLIRRFSIQILKGLYFFKKYDIIHCDMKPQNIVLKQEHKTGIKIIDVGSGCVRSEQIYTYIQSRFYRAPEIILGITYTCAIDMWSLGCILCELYMGSPIFPGENQTDQIMMVIEVLGLPDPELLKNACRSHKFFDGTMLKKRKPNSKSFSEILNCSEDLKFIDLIQQCLLWDPNKRIDPGEALLHPWILQGLPVDIRNQLIREVTKKTIFTT